MSLAKDMEKFYKGYTVLELQKIYDEQGLQKVMNLFKWANNGSCLHKVTVRKILRDIGVNLSRGPSQRKY